jgi:integrase
MLCTHTAAVKRRMDSGKWTRPDHLLRRPPSAATTATPLCQPTDCRRRAPKYIQAQLGHASIQITMDVYGHLLPGSFARLVDVLDTPTTPAQPPLQPWINSPSKTFT